LEQREAKEQISQNIQAYEVKLVQQKAAFEKALLEKEKVTLQTSLTSFKGNAHFKAGDYRRAIICYTKSLQQEPDNATVHVNRAMAFIKLRKWKEAEDDCHQCLDLEPKNIKAYYRRGIAKREQGQLKEALSGNLKRFTDQLDFERALVLEPANKSIKADYEALLLTVKPPKPKSTVQKIETLNEKEEQMQEFLSYTVSIEEIGAASDYDETLDWRAEPELSMKKKEHALIEESVTDDSEVAVASKEPAKESLVSSPSVELTTDPVITKLQSIMKHQPKSVPKSMFEFERDWKSLLKTPEDLLNYLEQIPLDHYPLLFKSTFESDHLASLLDLARMRFMNRGDLKQSFAILTQLTRVSRLNVALMFLNKHQEEQLKAMFQELARSEAIDSEQLFKVMKNYHITL
jgi:tetratricopeptide (TPR) repeat protein